MKIMGAFWGRGKCPVCERPYQKDIRLIWMEDDFDLTGLKYHLFTGCNKFLVGRIAEIKEGR